MKRYSIKQIVGAGLVFVIVTTSIFGTSAIPQYKTTSLQQTTVKKEIDFTANWYPIGYSKVALSGSQDIRSLKIKEGDSVSKGQVIAQLVDDTEYNQYKAAQASYYAAIKARNNAAATPMTPKSTLDTLQGQINAAYYQVKNAEVNLNKKKVKAPISGKVVTVSVSDYSTSSASLATSLTGAATTSGNYIVIANTKDSTFSVTISERDRARLQKDMKVVLSSRVSDELLTGKVTKLSTTPVTSGVEDPTYAINIKLDKYPSDFNFGAKLEGSIVIIERPNVQAVEYDAITVDSATTGSLLLLKNGKPEETKVTIGAVGDDAVEVTSGITKEDQIVLDQLADKKVISLRPWLKKLLGIKQ